MKTSTAVVALFAAVALGAAWPWFASHRAQATGIPTAPVLLDYLQRDRLIAFYEEQVRRDPSDQVTQRMLASQYLQRFRETGDLNDVTRAHAMATRSLSLQPQGNVQALSVIASSDIIFHHFPAALAAERASLEGDPSNDDARAQSASTLMELGRYEDARQLLNPPGQPGGRSDVDVDPRSLRRSDRQSRRGADRHGRGYPTSRPDDQYIGLHPLLVPRARRAACI